MANGHLNVLTVTVVKSKLLVSAWTKRKVQKTNQLQTKSQLSMITVTAALITLKQPSNDSPIL